MLGRKMKRKNYAGCRFIGFASTILLNMAFLLTIGCTGGGGGVTEQQEIDAPLYARISTNPDTLFIADSAWVEVDAIAPPEYWFVHITAWNLGGSGEGQEILSFNLLGIGLSGEIPIDSTLNYGAAKWTVDETEYITNVSGGGGNVEVEEYIDGNRLVGNFEFVLINAENSDTVTISEGFFDVEIDVGI